jgi:hypothetical protein
MSNGQLRSRKKEEQNIDIGPLIPTQDLLNRKKRIAHRSGMFKQG